MYNKISYINKLYIIFIIFNNDTTHTENLQKVLKVTKESGARLDFCRGKIDCNWLPKKMR